VASGLGISRKREGVRFEKREARGHLEQKGWGDPQVRENPPEAGKGKGVKIEKSIEAIKVNNASSTEEGRGSGRVEQ